MTLQVWMRYPCFIDKICLFYFGFSTFKARDLWKRFKLGTFENRTSNLVLIVSPPTVWFEKKIGTFVTNSFFCCHLQIGSIITLAFVGTGNYLVFIIILKIWTFTIKKSHNRINCKWFWMYEVSSFFKKLPFIKVLDVNNFEIT